MYRVNTAQGSWRRYFPIGWRSACAGGLFDLGVGPGTSIADALPLLRGAAGWHRDRRGCLGARARLAGFRRGVAGDWNGGHPLHAWQVPQVLPVRLEGRRDVTWCSLSRPPAVRMADHLARDGLLRCSSGPRCALYDERDWVLV